MNVIERLKHHILVDGFHIVADVEKSNGSWIVDDSGRRYLDCYSQFASQALGWNHPNLLANTQKLGRVAIQKLANSDMYSSVYADFVEGIAKITPDHKYYFFVDGGSLAVENAIKAAFDWKYQVTKDRFSLGSDGNEMDIIHFQQAFHGRSGYTLSLTNTGDIKTKFFPKFPWTRVLNPKMDSEILNAEAISIQQIKTALKKGNVAAIIIEPIQGEGGDNHFRKEFLKELRQLADEYEALLIFDEVQSGVGITGKMWAYQHFDVVPDLLCFGKKTQVCGFCSTDRIDLVPNNVFKIPGRINSTWGGNTVDMARAKIVFDTINSENLVDNARIVGGEIVKGLRNLEFANISNIRGMGLFIAFDLPDTETRNQAFENISKEMLILKSGNRSIRLRPHLTMSVEEGLQVVEFIKKYC